ncbi:DedA family protein [Bacillus lacus]|uniref:DedA family protein n=1 Tax=Metabacillus lacus TaxID=1983721 RepID=A0A7X2IW96_9BACI|nr:DedA family protein [Metabacillus lacus]MRX70779.1 DedA family protein [Metabacillus lacus]
MELEHFIDLIGSYGYVALFFSLWLGIFGLPIPDEAIVMCGGFASSLGILQPYGAFFVTYFGVISGLSIGYAGGRLLGAPVLAYFGRKNKWKKHIERAELLTARYGAFSIILSYFLPVIRHLVPYIVGANQMAYRKYALYSYSIGFIWTAVFFAAGHYLGFNIEAFSQVIHKAALLLFVIIVLAICSRILYKRKIIFSR